jgi:hypothetical protein
MFARNFVPKLRQLEQLQLELDNDHDNFDIKQNLIRNEQKP